MNIKIIPKCKCGEPVGEGRILCDRCVDEVNKRAMGLLRHYEWAFKKIVKEPENEKG